MCEQIRLDRLYLSHNGEIHLLQQLKMHKYRKKNQTNKPKVK